MRCLQEDCQIDSRSLVVSFALVINPDERITMLKSLIAGSLLLTGVAQAQQDFSSVTIRSEQVAEGIYMLQGSGGNIGLSFGEDGAFLIDDQYAPLSDKIMAAVKELTDGEIRFVINTHWHGDHTGGNENFGNSGAVIVAHDNVHQRMSTDQVMAFFGREVPAAPDAALPVLTFNDRVTLRLNGDDVSAIHTPHAHTDGDAIIHFSKANVLHMGDVFFNIGYPFIDVDSGGGIHGLIDAVNKGLMLANDTTKVIPGHGPLTDRAGLIAYRDLLVTLRDSVLALKAQGKSLEETIAIKPTAALDEKNGQAFIKADQIVTFIFNSPEQMADKPRSH